MISHDAACLRISEDGEHERSAVRMSWAGGGMVSGL